MPHNAEFHQGLYCLLRYNRSSDKKKNTFFKSYNLTPLGIYSGLSYDYCIKPEKEGSICISEVRSEQLIIINESFISDHGAKGSDVGL